MTPESLSIQFAAPVKVTDPAECDFYHRMDVPGLGQVGGAWDLRDCIKAYLGNYDFNGKRVLDVGTASGFLTFSMENEGAEVVSFDMVSGAQWDVVPQKEYRVDPQSYMALLVEADRRLKNAYWFTHERVGSKAKTWWVFSEGCIRRMLSVMGFEVIRTIKSNPRCLVKGREGPEKCTSFIA